MDEFLRWLVVFGTTVVTAMEAAPKFSVRAGVPADEGFVTKTFVETARTSSGAMRNIDSANFSAYHYSLINLLIDRGTLKVACPPNDEEVIYGFSVTGPKAIHLAYVKKPLRRYGIGKALLSHLDMTDVCFSLWTYDVTAWLKEKYPRMRYIPFWMGLNHG